MEVIFANFDTSNQEEADKAAVLILCFSRHFIFDWAVCVLSI